MLYSAYTARNALLAPFYSTIEAQADLLRWLEERVDVAVLRGARAVPETLAALRLTHERPAFGIDAVEVDGRRIPVSEEVVSATPFGSLLRFRRPDADRLTKVLAVPGLAGHFATLIRPTVRTLLRDHDVYVADWHNARDVGLSEGRFGFDEYVQHLVSFMRQIGPGTCLMAVCQPCPAVIAAASLMAADGDPAAPETLVLMSGPVDTRVNPGPVSRFAERQSVDALERRVIVRVSLPYRGAGRRVYPGFLQIAGFMGMDPRRHIEAFAGLARDIARGEEDSAERTRSFYEEYFAVLDIAAEFYLESARKVFIEHHLPRGLLEVSGRRIEPGRVTSAVLTVEGGSDEICPPGQTEAAHQLLTGIPAERHRHHLQEGVGHYGVFSGRRFDDEIYPVIRDFIAEFSDRAVAGADLRPSAW